MKDILQNRKVDDFHRGQFSKIVPKCSNLKRRHLGQLCLPEITETTHNGSKHRHASILIQAGLRQIATRYVDTQACYIGKAIN